MKKIITEWREYLTEQDPARRRGGDKVAAAISRLGPELEDLRKRAEEKWKELEPKEFSKWLVDFLKDPKNDFSEEERDQIYKGIIGLKFMPNVERSFEKIQKNLRHGLSKEKRRAYLRPLDQITNIVIHDTVVAEGGTYTAFTTKRCCLEWDCYKKDLKTKKCTNTKTACGPGTCRTCTKKGKGDECEGLKFYYTGAHYVITKDGTVKQTAPLTMTINHTTQPDGMNKKAVGIDIVNWGFTAAPGRRGKDFDMAGRDEKTGKLNMDTYATQAQLRSLYSLVKNLTGTLKNVPLNVVVPSVEKMFNPAIAGGKKMKVDPGVYAHGHIQDNKIDGTLPLVYLYARNMYGLNHKDAVKSVAQMFNEANGFKPRVKIDRRKRERIATEAKKKKTKVSKAGQKRVSKKIAILRKKEKKKPKQAIATAIAMEKGGRLDKHGRYKKKKKKKMKEIYNWQAKANAHKIKVKWINPRKFTGYAAREKLFEEAENK